jgi:signal transduction histidine kinase
MDDIIDIAKIEAEQLSISKSSACLFAIMDDIYLFFKQEQYRLKKEYIEFILKKPEGNPQIYTDIVRLKQILNNLLTFKFTDKGFIKVGYEAIKIKAQLNYIVVTKILFSCKNYKQSY